MRNFLSLGIAIILGYWIHGIFGAFVGLTVWNTGAVFFIFFELKDLNEALIKDADYYNKRIGGLENKQK